MKRASHGYLKVLSYCGLVMSIAPAILVFAGLLSKETYLNLMFLGMLLWFGTAIWWIKPAHLE